MGLKSDGSIKAWGDNSYRQRHGPTPNSDSVAIAGWNQSMGLKADGSIVACGQQCALAEQRLRRHRRRSVAQRAIRSTTPLCAVADLNCDGGVGGADLLILLANWG